MKDLKKITIAIFATIGVGSVLYFIRRKMILDKNTTSYSDFASTPRRAWQHIAAKKVKIKDVPEIQPDVKPSFYQEISKASKELISFLYAQRDTATASGLDGDYWNAINKNQESTMVQVYLASVDRVAQLWYKSNHSDALQNEFNSLYALAKNPYAVSSGNSPVVLARQLINYFVAHN